MAIYSKLKATGTAVNRFIRKRKKAIEHAQKQAPKIQPKITKSPHYKPIPKPIPIPEKKTTRTDWQKKARKGNDLLRWLEENKYNNDKLETIKSDLAILNEDIGKKGNQERFYSGENIDDRHKAMFEPLINELSEEVKRIKEMLKSDERQKNYDLTDQEYIDFKDNQSNFINKVFEKYKLDSGQKKDIYNISDRKGIHNDTIADIVKKALKELGTKQVKDGKLIRDIQPDELSNFVRKELYKLWLN